jgi:uncharacterized protein YndB with AHSA1/START domain
MKLDGTYTKRPDGTHVVAFARTIPYPVAKVWAGISDPAVLKNWLGNVEVEPKVGGAFVIRFRDMDVVMTGRITVFEPERVIEYTWRENSGASQSIVRWELAPATTGCALTLTHTFPPEAVENDVLGYLGGWHEFLEAIPEAIDGEFVRYRRADERATDAAYRLLLTGSASPKEDAVNSRVASVRFVRVLPGPVERVWAHLTDPKLLPGWFGDASTIEPRLGGQVNLMGGHIRGVVTQWAPPQRLTYTWNVFGPGDGPDAVSAYPESYLSFTLESFGAQVLLSLNHLPVLDRFEKQNAMGWHTMLDILGATLRGEEIKPRGEYMKKNAALYGVELQNLQR